MHFNIRFSQGSAATYFRCVGRSCTIFICTSSENATVKELSISIVMGHNNACSVFLRHSVVRTANALDNGYWQVSWRVIHFVSSSRLTVCLLCVVLRAPKKGERVELWEGSGWLKQHKLHVVRARQPSWLWWMGDERRSRLGVQRHPPVLHQVWRPT